MLKWQNINMVCLVGAIFLVSLTLDGRSEDTLTASTDTQVKTTANTVNNEESKVMAMGIAILDYHYGVGQNTEFEVIDHGKNWEVHSIVPPTSVDEKTGLPMITFGGGYSIFIDKNTGEVISMELQD